MTMTDHTHMAFDADLQDLVRMVAEMGGLAEKQIGDAIDALDRHDVGIGSRYIPGGGTRNWGIHRRLLSRSANAFARLMLGFSAHDVTSGYRCYRREVLQHLDLDALASHGYSFLVELLYRCVQAGYSVAETPIIFEDRAQGTSKMSSGEILGGVKNLFRLRFGKSH